MVLWQSVVCRCPFPPTAHADISPPCLPHLPCPAPETKPTLCWRTDLQRRQCIHNGVVAVGDVQLTGRAVQLPTHDGALVHTTDAAVFNLHMHRGDFAQGCVAHVRVGLSSCMQDGQQALWCPVHTTDAAVLNLHMHRGVFAQDYVACCRGLAQQLHARRATSSVPLCTPLMQLSSTCTCTGAYLCAAGTQLSRQGRGCCKAGKHIRALVHTTDAAVLNLHMHRDVCMQKAFSSAGRAGLDARQASTFVPLCTPLVRLS